MLQIERETLIEKLKINEPFWIEKTIANEPSKKDEEIIFKWKLLNSKNSILIEFQIPKEILLFKNNELIINFDDYIYNLSLEIKYLSATFF